MKNIWSHPVRGSPGAMLKLIFLKSDDELYQRMAREKK